MNWKQQKWILLPDNSGYCYGVEARGKDRVFTELHGGFKTYGAAHVYRDGLLEEFSDYEYAKVVKIETPEVSA